MSNEKTPEQRGCEWCERRQWIDINPLDAFLAGRADFITSELPKLKQELFEASQVQFNKKPTWKEPEESAPYVMWGQIEYIIDRIIAMAEKGET